MVVGVEIDITAAMGMGSQSQQESLVGRPLGIHTEAVRDERERIHHSIEQKESHRNDYSIEEG